MKVRVIGAGTQLLQTEGLLERNPAADATALSRSPDPDLDPIDCQLRRIELSWSSLQEDVPVVQEALHKVRRLQLGLISVQPQKRILLNRSHLLLTI